MTDFFNLIKISVNKCYSHHIVFPLELNRIQNWTEKYAECEQYDTIEIISGLWHCSQFFIGKNSIQHMNSNYYHVFLLILKCFIIIILRTLTLISYNLVYGTFLQLDGLLQHWFCSPIIYHFWSTIPLKLSDPNGKCSLGLKKISNIALPPPPSWCVGFDDAAVTYAKAINIQIKYSFSFILSVFIYSANYPLQFQNLTDDGKWGVSFLY